MFQNIPAELKALPQWICWKHQIVDGRQTKVPYRYDGQGKADISIPATWGSFEQAVGTAQSFGLSGIGFVLTKSDPYAGIDIDDKEENPASEEQLARQQKVLEAFDSYTERSVGARWKDAQGRERGGYHILVRGQIPSGVDRDHIGVYSEARYLTFTGDIVRNAPIRDYQELLTIIHAEMTPVASVALEDREAILSDLEVVEMAMRAANAEKFNSLCAGDLTGYPSQSEADFALLSILAFYTQDNEQVRRLFRMSALGKREKATRNDTYLNFALGKIRAQQPPPVDLSELAGNANAILQQKAVTPPAPPIPSPTPLFLPPPPPPPPAPAKVPPASSQRNGLTLPTGLVGELAQYFHQTATRPVLEIALASALALTAGVCGRSYNISGTGLNQYIILLARTGSGKEGALMGIENLISAVRPGLPMVEQFIGPAAFASGQALVKVLNEKPCFLSVLGEFGLTLQQLSDNRANSAQLMLRKVLLDLYAKSGWNRMLRSSVYADSEKNTKMVQAPNVTILGESTPETFFDGLDASHIAEGLIPRFSIIEYNGDRPPRNRKANQPPPPALAQKFSDLVAISLTTSNNNTVCHVELDDHSTRLLDAFDERADRKMNASRMDVEVQVWNRAHLKALKLSALLAVGVNPHRPIVTADLAQWAIDFVVADVERIASRFRDGDVGQGDSKQFHDLKRAIEIYLTNPPKAVLDRFAKLQAARLVPYAYLSQRTASVASFRNDRFGATNALKRTVQTFVDSGMLVEITRDVLAKNFQFSGVTYGIGSYWQ